MKKLLVLITVLALAVSACGLSAFAETASAKFDNPYVKDGLYALYQGNFNTLNGQDKDAESWADLSGNGYDIAEIPTDSATWADDGLEVSATKIYLPSDIKELINTDEYTVEFAIDEFDADSIGTEFATFVNNDGNDNFSLFLRVNAGNNNLEFKCAGNARTKVPSGREILSDGKVTLAVTFESGAEVCLYVNGELKSTVTQTATMAVDGEMFIGHPNETRHYDAKIKSLRFYDRALTEEEILANAQVDGSAETSEPAESTEKPADETPVATEIVLVDPTPGPTEEPTEAPTEEPTEEPHEEPTTEPTTEPTEAPKQDATAKPEDTGTKEPEEKKGCGSSIAGSAAVVLAGAMLVLKKKEN